MYLIVGIRNSGRGSNVAAPQVVTPSHSRVLISVKDIAVAPYLNCNIAGDAPGKGEI